MEKLKRPGIDNLKPFKKGEDPRRHITGEKKLPKLKDLIVKVLSEEQGGITGLEAMVKAMRNEAIKGNVKAFDILTNRIAGKVKEQLEVTGLEGDPTEPKVWVIETIVEMELESPKPKRKNGK